MTNLNNELSMDELEAVSGGKTTVLGALAAGLSTAAGDVAGALGANVAAYWLHTAAYEFLR